MRALGPHALANRWVEFLRRQSRRVPGGASQPRDIVMSQRHGEICCESTAGVNETVKPMTT